MYNNDIQKLNIRPKVSVYKLFSRLNYKPYYAIAEFVDNSTASFFEHKNIFKFYNIKSITINIDYDEDLNELTISDDAYGMELEDFKRAILLGAVPENVTGRNEFGMGLKTAASWFGDVWSVESTEFNSPNKYKTEINIPFLNEHGEDEINIYREDADPKEHGTIIKIKELTKSLKTQKTKNKIKNHIASMYRRDIRSGDLKIYFNGEVLEYRKPKILTFRNNYWEKQIAFNFEFEGKKYDVDGFVSILEPGGYDKAGFALFRRDRVIIGGEGENYKPLEIFAQHQSQISLKLCGELNMDDFQVNQAKDGFVWDGGLEEKFIEELKRTIYDYIKIAEISKKDRAREEGLKDEDSNKVFEDVSASLETISRQEDIVTPSIESNDVQKYLDELKEQNIEIEQREVKDESKTRYYPSVKITADSKIDILVKWIEEGNTEDWLKTTIQEGKILIDININHNFFKPFSNENKFRILLEKLAIAFILAERKAYEETTFANNLVPVNQIRLDLNEKLAEFAKV